MEGCRDMKWKVWQEIRRESSSKEANDWISRPSEAILDCNGLCQNLKYPIIATHSHKFDQNFWPYIRYLTIYQINFSIGKSVPSYNWPYIRYDHISEDHITDIYCISKCFLVLWVHKLFMLTPIFLLLWSQPCANMSSPEPWQNLHHREPTNTANASDVSLRLTENVNDANKIEGWNKSRVRVAVLPDG